MYYLTGPTGQESRRGFAGSSAQGLARLESRRWQSRNLTGAEAPLPNSLVVAEFSPWWACGSICFLASHQPGTTLTSQRSELPTVPSYVAARRQFPAWLLGAFQASRNAPLDTSPPCEGSPD